MLDGGTLQEVTVTAQKNTSGGGSPSWLTSLIDNAGEIIGGVGSLVNKTPGTVVYQQPVAQATGGNSMIFVVLGIAAVAVVLLLVLKK